LPRWPRRTACPSGIDRHQRRHDSPERQNTEESVAAGIAAVSGNATPARYAHQGSLPYSIARNMFEIKIATLGAVCIIRKCDGHAPGIKSSIARMTSPRPEPGKRAEKVRNPVAVGTKTIRAAALWTNHSCRPVSTALIFAAYPKHDRQATVGVFFQHRVESKARLIDLRRGI
jgi:hypothetical protein